MFLRACVCIRHPLTTEPKLFDRRILRNNYCRVLRHRRRRLDPLHPLARGFSLFISFFFFFFFYIRIMLAAHVRDRIFIANAIREEYVRVPTID